MTKKVIALLGGLVLCPILITTNASAQKPAALPNAQVDPQAKFLAATRDFNVRLTQAIKILGTIHSRAEFDKRNSESRGQLRLEEWEAAQQEAKRAGVYRKGKMSAELQRELEAEEWLWNRLVHLVLIWAPELNYPDSESDPF